MSASRLCPTGTTPGRHDFEQLYTRAGGKVDGVYVVNDGLAVSSLILKKNGQNGKVPVTGQDALDRGSRRTSLTGRTVRTTIQKSAARYKALAETAIAMVKWR